MKHIVAVSEVEICSTTVVLLDWRIVEGMTYQVTNRTRTNSACPKIDKVTITLP